MECCRWDAALQVARADGKNEVYSSRSICVTENRTGSHMAKIRSCWRVEIVVKMSLTVTDLRG